MREKKYKIKENIKHNINYEVYQSHFMALQKKFLKYNGAIFPTPFTIYGKTKGI